MDAKTVAAKSHEVTKTVAAKSHEVTKTGSSAKSPKEAYEFMLAQTQTSINRLLSCPVHYEAVRLKRNPALGLLILAFATARTRLETVISPDVFVEQAIERFQALLNQLVQSSSDEWAHQFSPDKVTLDIIGCLFCPPDIDSNPDLLIPSIDPLVFDYRNAYDIIFDETPIETHEHVMGRLIHRTVRRASTIHKILGASWASALEAANWWRVCSTLSPSPQPPYDAMRQALASFERFQQGYKKYLETFSPYLDQTGDADDYEVRAEVVRQNFKLDVHAFHRSYETAAERREKIERIIESRQHVLK